MILSRFNGAAVTAGNTTTLGSFKLSPGAHYELQAAPTAAGLGYCTVSLNGAGEMTWNYNAAPYRFTADETQQGTVSIKAYTTSIVLTIRELK